MAPIKKKMMIWTISCVVGLCIIVFITRSFTSQQSINPAHCYRVDRGQIVDTFNAQGTLISDKVKDVLSSAEGEVKRIHVTVNQKVHKGDAIITLENPSLTHDLPLKKKMFDLATFELKIANDKYEQATLLFAKGGISKDELDRTYLDYQRSLYTNYENAQKAYQDVAAEMEGLSVRAPFSGIITNIPLQEGAIINKNQHVFSIVDITRPKITIVAPQTYFSSLHIGQDAVISHPRIPRVAAKITMIQTEMDEKKNEGATLTITCIPTQPLNAFFYDLMVDVVIVLQQKQDVMRVPLAAVHKNEHNETYFVTKKHGKEVVQVPVVLGIHNSEFAEIREGLTCGDIIVKDGGAAS